MKVAVIGAGAMGGAIAKGVLRGNVIPARDLIVSNPSQGKLEHFAHNGAVTTTDNRKAVAEADWVILAVKPWLVEKVLADVRDLFTPGQILVSVAAGVSSDNLVEWSGGVPSVFTAIPNIAIEELASITFIQPIQTSEEQVQAVSDFFGSMGKVLICDEKHLSAGMALASCGIAYAFRYIRAASEGGVELGFKAHESQNIVMQTLLGAVKLLEATGKHPEEAIDQVTTPGGITIKGLNAMEQSGFTNAVIQGLKASVK